MSARCLERLDPALRKTLADDPEAAVLKLAVEAGVSADIRRRYAVTAGAYLSQHVYIDPAAPPGMLMLQLQDANGWEHRVSWGEFQWTWLGRQGTPSRRVEPRLPQPGGWRELRVPLVFLDMHDRAIHGISFGQHGGRRVLWGRTAVVVDGKEHVILDGQVPECRTRGLWDWLDAPGRAGTKAHASTPPIGPDDAVEHACFDLKAPVAVHVPPPLSGAASRPAEEVLAVLAAEVPKLGRTDHARRFFDAMARLAQPDLAGQVALCKWFLKNLPEHPSAPDVLGGLLRLLREAQADDPAGAVDAIIEECRVPQPTRYAYRRKYANPESRFLREWQVIGPFRASRPVRTDQPYPPEARRPAMGDKFQAIRGEAGWQTHKSETDYVDLARLWGEAGPCAGYAVCWVQAEKGRPAVLELGADAGCKVWLNGRQVHSAMSPDRAAPGDHRVRCYLSAGWNEILVKVVQADGQWGFFAELVDPEGRGPLGEVKVAATQPAR
jgi:hypothetical protein